MPKQAVRREVQPAVATPCSSIRRCLYGKDFKFGHINADGMPVSSWGGLVQFLAYAPVGTREGRPTFCAEGVTCISAFHDAS